MRVFMLWLLAMIALVIWLAPPFEAREQRLRIEAEPPKPGPVICPFAPPCWRDGRPIVGAG
jgi:hypothetical protein